MLFSWRGAFKTEYETSLGFAKITVQSGLHKLHTTSLSFLLLPLINPHVYMAFITRQYNEALKRLKSLKCKLNKAGVRGF